MASPPDADDGFFEQIVEGMPQLAWVAGRAGDTQYVNRRWTEYTGVAPAMAMGRGSLQAIHPDDIAAAEERWRTARRDGQAFEMELRLCAGDGSCRWFLVRAAPLRDRSRSVARWLGTCTDIDQVRRVLDENRLLAHRLALQVEQSPLSVQAFAPDGLCLRVNRAWEQLWGLTLADIPGYNLLEDPQLAPILPLVRPVFAGGAAVRTPPVLYRPEMGKYAGRDVWTIANFYPVIDAGRVVEVVLTHEDITAVKESELALRRHADELQRAIADVQQFAYLASHDLREPLRMIISYLELLERRRPDAFDPQALSWLRSASSGAARMRGMVDGVLAYASAGSTALAMQPVDASAAASTVLANLHLQIEESGSRVELAPLPPVRADPTMLTQVLQNLVSNAIKFRRPGTGATVRVSSEAADGGRTRIVVDDDGTGLTDAQLPRLFGLFQRLHEDSGIAGSGIGLAVCKRAVERMGGSIAAERSPLGGLRISFTLPSA